MAKSSGKRKRATKYEEKVKVDASFSKLMKELFPPVKPEKNKALPKIKGKSNKK